MPRIRASTTSTCSASTDRAAPDARAVVAETGIVLVSAQVLAGGRHHRLRLYAELSEAVRFAHAVDRQRAGIVAREGAARHESHGRSPASRPPDPQSHEPLNTAAWVW